MNWGYITVPADGGISTHAISTYKEEVIPFLVAYEMGVLGEGDVDDLMVVLRQFVTDDMKREPDAKPAPGRSTPGRIYY